MTAPVPYECGTVPCTCPAPEPEWTAEDAVAALTALCGVYEAKQPAHRFVPVYLIREALTGVRER